MPEPCKVLLGVCGGIAAYKSAELVRELQRSGAEVRVIMTRSAQEFIKPLTFASLTGHKVFMSLWDSPSEASVIEHIAQAQWADVLVIAPATANTLAKLAHGIADDFLSASYLATNAKVVVAPAMNVNMWNHPATRANISVLKQRGHRMVEPGGGYLACGMTGDGRLADIEIIAREVFAQVNQRQDLLGETVLVTAGGTREPIDPVGEWDMLWLRRPTSGERGSFLFQLRQRWRHRRAANFWLWRRQKICMPLCCIVCRRQRLSSRPPQWRTSVRAMSRRISCIAMLRESSN
jgi:phosphopantothenoylcysteine decarboxylase/phosphopantothenate--cysteine ligase